MVLKFQSKIIAKVLNCKIKGFARTSRYISMKKIFVFLTFKDFNAERDAIQKLNAIVRDYA